MKRLKTLTSFHIFKSEIKKSKTYSGWCPFQGLSMSATIMQTQSGRTLPLKDAKQNSSFFLELACRHIIFSLLLLFCVKTLFCKQSFNPRNTFIRKGKDPKPESDSYLWPMDPDPGGPKTCGSGFPNTGSEKVTNVRAWTNRCGN